MSDELVQGLIKQTGLRVVLATAAGMSQKARALQQTSSTSGVLLAQALTSAVLMGSLQKEKSRINLQLECDGPLRGLFADADNEGNARGYVKNPNVDIRGHQGEFEWRPAFGNSGYLSVLRDLGGGEYYRSSVQLERFNLALDLERYYATSEQIRTMVVLDVVSEGSEELAKVGGALLQVLPGEDANLLDDEVQRLRDGGAFRRALAEGDGNARGLLRTLYDAAGIDLLQSFPVSYRCDCSKERVLRALVAMGRAELLDVIATDKKAEVMCHFCSTQYVVEEDELRTLLDKTAASSER